MPCVGGRSYPPAEQIDAGDATLGARVLTAVSRRALESDIIGAAHSRWEGEMEQSSVAFAHSLPPSGFSRNPGN
jgi:hypothetical protein